jgi:hypothetical protein
LGTGSVANRDRVFRCFEDARTFVQGLELRTQNEWKAFSRSGRRPTDIPDAPDKVYLNEGWAGYGDWLGTGRVSNRRRVFLPFTEARARVHALSLASQDEWGAYCNSGQKIHEIPANPNVVYKDDGWIGYGDWLGTGKVATAKRTFRPFTDARCYVNALGLKTITEWRQFCASGEKPCDIPSAPDQTYKNEGWTSFDDWLGVTGFLPFVGAREHARSLHLRSGDAWRQYCMSGRKPANIPADPKSVYSNEGWTSMGDWLGSGRVANQKRVFRPFHEAREYCRSLGLASQTQWKSHCKLRKLPIDIPSNPNLVYKNCGWDGIEDWLGTTKASRQARRAEIAAGSPDHNPVARLVGAYKAD